MYKALQLLALALVVSTLTAGCSVCPWHRDSIWDRYGWDFWRDWEMGGDDRSYAEYKLDELRNERPHKLK